jgi:autotransporter-associated beta strand protein
MALSSGTFSNWARNNTGTLAGGVVPGGASVNVIFGATGGSQQALVTTGADMTLNSITFNDTTAVTISGSNLITLNATATGTATTTAAAATVTPSSAVAVTAFASATNTIAANLGLAGAQSFSVAAGKTLNVSGIITGAGSLTKRDSGLLTLSGTNIYVGTTTVSAGTLSFNSIADVGAASALGSPFTAANGTIAVGASGTAATLVYTGTGHSTNRVVNLAGTTGGATIDQSGSGLLRFTSAFTATGAGLKTLTLQGSTSGTGEIANAIVNNDGTNRTAVTKAGSGVWVLSGSNTYTGTTTITGGVLQIGAGGTTGSIVNTSPVSVASGAAIAFNRSDALTYSGTISGLGGLTKLGNGGLTLNTVQTYTGPTTIGSGTLITGVANAISGSSALTIGSAGSRGAFEIDHALTISNLTFTGLGGEISTASTGTATFSSTTGTATINVLSGSNAFHANATLSSPTLVDVADGAYFSFHNNLAGSGSGTLTKSGLGTLNLTGDSDTLQSNFFITAGLVTIGSGMNQIGTGTTTLSGGATLDLGGQSFSDRIVVLNGTILNAGGTATTTTIQGTSSIDGSTAGTYNITSTGSAVFNAAVGSGTSLVSVNVNSGAGSGGQATFNEAIGSLGNIVVNNGGTAAFASTVAGSVISHGASTFTGNVLSTSEVQVQSDGSAAFAGGMAGHADVAGTATFTGAVSGTADVFGTATFGSASSLTGKLTTHSAGTTLLDNVAAAITGDIHNDGQLTIDRATGSQTISGAISGTGGIVKTGAGVLVLEGANSSYTGGITLSSGTIRAGSANALGLGTLALNAGGLDLNGQALTIGMLTGSAGTSVSSSMAGAASLKSEFEGSSTFNGVISNGAGTVAFEKAGGGTLTLTGVQTYTGNTIISGGVLALDSGASLANSIYIKAGNVAGDNGKLDVTALGSFAVANGQMLGGHGDVIGDVTIANGAILSPGGSVGTLINNGDMTWGGGGQFLFEIFNATNDNVYGPGTDWDQLLVVGNLDITSSSGNPYVINLQTLADPNDNTAGLMPVENWNDAQEYAWKFVTASTTITSFNASVFTVNPANFQNPYGGTFSVQRGDQVTGGTDSELYIVYAAIPEPGTLVLAAIGLAAAGWHLRRRRK